MRTLYLIGCGARKENRETSAGLLYTGSLFVKMRRYVRRQPDSTWRILSAKHGLLHPAELVRPYNKRMPRGRVLQMRWAEPVRDAIRSQFPADEYRVCILAGADYCSQLAPMLRQVGFEVDEPMKGFGMGQRMSWLVKNTRPIERIVDVAHELSDGASELAGVSLMHTGAQP